MLTPAAKREAVAHACTEHGVSQRRACEVLAVDRSTTIRTSLRDVERTLILAVYSMIGASGCNSTLKVNCLSAASGSNSRRIIW